MTNPIHIMLDLETWGKKPGCDIRSIGACVFDPVTGFVHDGSLGTIRPYYQAVDNIAHDTLTGFATPGNPMIPTMPIYVDDHLWHFDGIDTFRKYPLHRDLETVKWWNDQSADAQAAFADPIALADGLRGFANWLAVIGQFHYPSDGNFDGSMNKDKPLCLWAHGPQFDCTILAAAYDACGLSVPWHYRAPRDTRTIFDAAGIDDHSAWLAAHPGPLHILHHALDDAICQARAVCAAYDRIILRHDDNAADIRNSYGGN